MPHGVVVHTGDTFEHYPSADHWNYDAKGALDIFDVEGLCLATFLVGTWLRVELGSPPDPEQPK